MSGNYRSYADAGMAALMNWYDSSTGRWTMPWFWNDWWHSANALEVVIDYSARTNTTTYLYAIANTFAKNKSNNFLNNQYDDEGWWALAWIKAYDLTGVGDYLNMAETIFKDMNTGWDQFCHGGVMWKKWDGPLWQEFKNAITNELFLTIAARLYQRTSNQSYLNCAQAEWSWFSARGLIGQQTDISKNQVKNMINDGLDGTTCASSGAFYTYNQGVILGGLVDLYKITKDPTLLAQAQAIADAMLNSDNNYDPNTRLVSYAGILTEVCESTNDCKEDGPQFKGIFMRNLSYLCDVTNKSAYKQFILNNANSIWLNNRNSGNQFGLHWAGPFDQADAVRQTSAMDALIAALSGFSANEDWTHGAYYGSRGTLFADVTGDGRADAIVVNNDTVTVRRSDGTQFTPNEDWTHGAYYGSRGTFFADVDGDGKADAIVVNDNTVTVRRSTGTAFGPNEDWTHGAYYGSRGTFFADVDGDGKADAIVVNDDKITVRRSTGSAFGAYESWTHEPYYGSVGTYFADVDGDGCADAIVVNADKITVRRSMGSGFGPNESWTSDPFIGSRGTFFADVDGDGKADAIAVNDTTVLVRRSMGGWFGPVEDWTHGAYYGSRGSYFADVTGDGRADAIVVNDTTVTVRRAFGV